MPAVAQISVNFSSLDKVRAEPGLALQSNQTVVNPVTLVRYALYDKEDSNNNFKLSDANHLKYDGGFLTSGNKINVKHDGNLILRKNLLINQTLRIGPAINPEPGIHAGLDVTNNILGDKDGNLTIQAEFRGRGDFYIGDNGNEYSKFTIDSATGNTSTDGTLLVNGNVTVTSDDNHLTTFDNFSVSQKRFDIESTTGNIHTRGNITARGDLTVTTTQFNTTNNRKFYVQSSTGNTETKGTLTVQSTTTLNNSVTINGGTSEFFRINDGSGNQLFNINADTGYINAVNDLEFTANSQNSHLQKRIKNIRSHSQLSTITMDTTYDYDPLTVYDFKTYSLYPRNNWEDGTESIHLGYRTDSRTISAKFIKFPSNRNIEIKGFVVGNSDWNAAGDLDIEVKHKIERTDSITGNYTVSVADNMRTYIVDAAASIILPALGSEAVGMQVSFIRNTGGAVTFVGQGTNVNSALNFKSLAFNGSAGTAYYGRQNIWWVFGDLLP